jgi:hypothetical protein
MDQKAVMGNVTRMVVPAPTWLVISIVPPARPARERMPAIPRWPSLAAASAAPIGIPRPSSATSKTKSCGALESHFDRSRVGMLEGIEHRLAADPQRGRFNHRLQRAPITTDRELEGNRRPRHH